MAVIPKQSGQDGNITVSFHGHVSIVTMDCGENRFNDIFISRMHVALNHVVSNPDVKIMITVGKGKFFSNGLDVDYLNSIDDKKNAAFNAEFGSLLARVLQLPLLTIAALNGHTFAGGALLALVHDYRVMNTERGWFCLNEVQVGRFFRLHSIELLKLRLSAQTLLNSILGRRHTAEEAKASGIVDVTCTSHNLIDVAIKLGNSILPINGIPIENLGNMKAAIYRDNVFEKLKEEDLLITSRL